MRVGKEQKVLTLEECEKMAKTYDLIKKYFDENNKKHLQLFQDFNSGGVKIVNMDVAAYTKEKVLNLIREEFKDYNLIIKDEKVTTATIILEPRDE